MRFKHHLENPYNSKTKLPLLFHMQLFVFHTGEVKVAWQRKMNPSERNSPIKKLAETFYFDKRRDKVTVTTSMKVIYF